MRSEREEPCSRIFGILLAQLIFLAIWSLPAQAGPVFVQRFFFGLDFYDFYRAATDWLHGTDPYLRGRIFTPPPSLLVGTAFSWLPYGAARYLFFAVNLGIVVVSVRACARRLGLSPRCIDSMTGITLLFYPVYFLAERGNLDGLILGCLCWAYCTQNKNLRAALVAIAGGLKLYPLLLVGPAVRNRQWRFALGTLLLFVLLMLPFSRLAGSFLHAVTVRGAIYQQTENISPAGIIIAIAGQRVGSWIFLTYWAGTLILTLYRQKEPPQDGIIMLPFLAWMVAFPLQVFPYGGVLLLPVLAWKLREMEGRRTELNDKLFLNGFLLVGVQAWALTGYFHDVAPGRPVFHLMNSVGMCLILGSLAYGSTRVRPALLPEATESALLSESPN